MTIGGLDLVLLALRACDEPCGLPVGPGATRADGKASVAADAFSQNAAEFTDPGTRGDAGPFDACSKGNLSRSMIPSGVKEKRTHELL